MKKLAGAAVFVVTLGVALLVTNYYDRRPSAPPPPAPRAAPPPAEDAPPPALSQAEVTHEVRLVTLDMGARKSHTTLTVEHEPGAPAPEKLWVCTGFFVPGGSVFCDAPVLVEKPFASGRRATLTVSAECGWCGRRDVPAAGYYADVKVSAVSAADATIEHVNGPRKLVGVTPVVVEEGRRGAR